MEEKKIIIPYTEASVTELGQGERELVEQARQAAAGSYSPYSRFAVGAAIRMESGEIVRGANQENAAYPSSICAERSACYWASANRPGQTMEVIAIAARRQDDDWQTEPIPPCGACRQALLEYETMQHAPMKVILAGRDKVWIFPSVASLLPCTFTEF